MSRVLSSDNSNIEVGKLPPNELLLKFRVLREEDKWTMSRGMSPERLRKERFNEVIKEELGAHLMPDQEHQAGESL